MRGDAFSNRAGPAGAALNAEVRHEDCCSDPLVFAMRDKHHEFSLGLITVLQCLKIAEEEGFIPPLPFEWWEKINYSYHNEVATGATRV